MEPRQACSELATIRGYCIVAQIEMPNAATFMEDTSSDPGRIIGSSGLDFLDLGLCPP
jgi:hypothetical protein